MLVSGVHQINIFIVKVKQIVLWFIQRGQALNPINKFKDKYLNVPKIIYGQNCYFTVTFLTFYELFIDINVQKKYF